MTDCEHGFVVRAAQEEHRFQCKECDERFIRHPEIIRKIEEERRWRQEEAKAVVDLVYPVDEFARRAIYVKGAQPPPITPVLEK